MKKYYADDTFDQSPLRTRRARGEERAETRQGVTVSKDL